MELILARHGNTFVPGQPAVWVGSQNDLPLVASGEAQAKALGKTLLTSHFIPTAIYTGPLKRMTQYAKILLAEMDVNQQPTIDLRLNEIDYGQWSGLTKEEVCHQFGADQYENWEIHSQWPTKGEWKESAALVTNRIRDFTDDLLGQYTSGDKILVVASNGCLRYFLDLMPGQLQKQIKEKSAKIATGSMCKLTYENKTWRLDYWNMKI